MEYSHDPSQDPSLLIRQRAEVEDIFADARNWGAEGRPRPHRAIRAALEALAISKADVARWGADHGLSGMTRPNVSMALNGRIGRDGQPRPLTPEMYLATLGIISERLGRKVGLRDIGVDPAADPAGHGAVEWYHAHPFPPSGRSRAA